MSRTSHSHGKHPGSLSGPGPRQKEGSPILRSCRLPEGRRTFWTLLRVALDLRLQLRTAWPAGPPETGSTPPSLLAARWSERDEASWVLAPSHQSPLV